MIKVGDTDSIDIKIGTEDILNALTVASVTEASFSAMLTYVKRVILKAVSTSKGNLLAFAGFTVLGLATTAVQEIFKDDIEALADLYIKIDIEAYERVVTRQGKKYTIMAWRTTGFNAYIA